MKQPASLGLNFIGRRWTGGLGGWLLLVIGTTNLLVAFLGWQDVRDETLYWQDKADQWERSVKRAHHTGDATNTNLRPQIEAAAKVLEQLSIPWSGLYSSLENSADDNVTLLVIHPDPEKGEIRLQGEARDFASLRAYLQRLGESDIFTDIRVQSQRVRESDTERPIVFSVVAVWRSES